MEGGGLKLHFILSRKPNALMLNKGTNPYFHLVKMTPLSHGRPSSLRSAALSIRNASASERVASLVFEEATGGDQRKACVLL